MFLADGGGGGGGSPFDAIGKSMDMFAGAAASGGFAVNETGGKALLQAIQNMKDWVDENRNDIQRLSFRIPLGSTTMAEALKPYMNDVLSDGQGFSTMLMKFRDSLNKAEEGIKDAMKNYQATDQGGQARFT